MEARAFDSCSSFISAIVRNLRTVSTCCGKEDIMWFPCDKMSYRLQHLYKVCAQVASPCLKTPFVRLPHIGRSSFPRYCSLKGVPYNGITLSQTVCHKEHSKEGIILTMLLFASGLSYFTFSKWRLANVPGNI